MGTVWWVECFMFYGHDLEYLAGPLSIIKSLMVKEIVCGLLADYQNQLVGHCLEFTTFERLLMLMHLSPVW
jgi:hypothetical protein